jgi:uncharacterized membrane protein
MIETVSSFLKTHIRVPYFCYMLVLTVVGIAFVFITPPFQTPDEQTHLYRTYQLSEGHLIAKKLSYGAGDTLPVSLSESFKSFRDLLFQPDKKVNFTVLKAELKRPLDRQRTAETRFENTAPYPPLAYLPQIIGVSVGKFFSANPIILLYLARLANLGVWLALLYFCMKKQPRVALPLFAFALLPIVAFQAASASADVMTAGAGIFFALEVLRIATAKAPVAKSDMIILIVTGAVLALCKLPYILLILLVSLIPRTRFASLKEQLQWKIAVVAIPGIMALAWLAAAYKSFVNLQAVADAPAQGSFILHHPLSYLHTLATTYLGAPSDGIYIQTIGQLGWLDTKLTFWSMLFAFAAVLLATIGIATSKSPPLPTRTLRLGATGVLLLIVGAISTLLYLTWTTPGAPVVDGLQGRYYVPLIGVIIIVLLGLLGNAKQQAKRVTLLVYSMLTCTTLATIITLLYRYY